MKNKTPSANKVSLLLKNENVQSRLKSMLDKNAESFATSVINAVSSNSMLNEAEPMSIIKSAMVAASLKLAVDPNLGFSAIVPYNSQKGKQAQFQMMYKGYIQLAIRSGQYKTINVTEVYKDELKEHNPFTGETTFTDASEWKMRYEEAGEVAGFYAYFELLTGFKKSLFMTMAEVENHAKTYSQSYRRDIEKGRKNSRWTVDFNAMGKKTVLKLLLSKFGILSVELERAVTFDQAKIGGSIEEPQAEYIDNPEYKEKEAAENPFDEVVDAEYEEVKEGE